MKSPATLRAILMLLFALLPIPAAFSAFAAPEPPQAGGPWIRVARLTAMGETANSGFGFAAALSADGSTLAAGAPLYSAAGDNRGALYIYRRYGPSWQSAYQAARLILPAGQNADTFGLRVAISADGQTIAAVAPNNPGGGIGRGIIAVYQAPPGGWSDTLLPTAELTIVDALNNDQIGALAISADGRTIAAGSQRHNLLRGIVYVFERPGATWSSTAFPNARLSASDPAIGNSLGSAVAISADGGTIVAGAAGRSSDGQPRGALYVYVRPGTAWPALTTETARLTAPAGTDDRFLGGAVAISADGGTVIGGASTASGAQSNAYVFVRGGPLWPPGVEAAANLRDAAGPADALFGGVATSADAEKILISTPTSASSTLAGLFVRPSSGWTNSITPTEQLRVDSDQSVFQFTTVGLSGDGATIALAAFDGAAAAGEQEGIYLYQEAPFFVQAGPPAALIGVPYSYTFTVQSPLGQTFSISDGTLPPGITLDPPSGTISGTPAQLGVYRFSVRITDSQGNTRDVAVALHVAANRTMLPVMVRP